MLRTQDPVEFVGYCPKYFAKDFEKLFNLSKESFNIKVKQILDSHHKCNTQLVDQRVY